MPKKRRKTKRPVSRDRVVQTPVAPAAAPEASPPSEAATAALAKGASAPRTAGLRTASWRTAAPVLSIAVLVIVSYFPAMAWGGFVWDDRIFTESLEVRTWQGLWNMWFVPDTMTEVHYWPLVYTTFWLEHKLWGFDPTGYHIVNVVLHFLNSWLLLRILSRLQVRVAWLAAAVFAVHPVHVDSVAWVIERKDVLSGLMYLGAVLAWLRFTAEPRARHYLALLGLLVLGMLSKSVVVTLPVALGIVQWWRHGRLTRTDLLRLAPLLVVAAGIALADLAYLRSRSVTEYDYTFIERLLIAAHATWLYFAKIAWPASLAVIYPFWEVAASRWVEWLYVLGIVALLAVLWWLRDRITRGPLAGALFFGVTLFPTLGFFDHYYITYSFVADRFQYLASAGPIVVLTGACMAAASKVMLHTLSKSKVLTRRIYVGVVLGAFAVLAVLTAITWRQSAIYENPITFFGHIVSLNPQANGAYTGLSAALYVDGRVEESYEAARNAIEVNEEDVRAHLNVSFPLRDMGRPEEAEKHMRRALELGPDALQGLEIYLALGSLLQDQGRDEEALEAARQAVRYGPRSLTANVNLGSILIKLSRHEEAEQHLRRARQIEPNDPNLLHNLAEALRLQGRLAEALDAYQGVVALNPDSALAYAAMGDILFQLERHAEAITVLKRTVELEPTASFVPAMYVYMGRSAQALGRLDEAEQHYRRVLAANPEHRQARALLAQLRGTAPADGRVDEPEDAP